MNRFWWILAGVLILPAVAFSQAYQYAFTDQFSTDASIKTAWQQNNGSTFTLDASAGLTTTSSNGASLIYNGTPLDGSYQYEVNATLKLASSGTNDGYAIYLRASNNALVGPTSTGTFYALELQNVTWSSDGKSCSATYALWEGVNGTVSNTGGSVGCQQDMTLRMVYGPNGTIAGYINNVVFLLGTNSDIATGQPGVGVRGAPPGNGIVSVSIGNLEHVAPTGASGPLTSSVFPDHIDLQWGGAVDNTGGIGIGFQSLYRNGTLLAILNPAESAYTDTTVTHDTAYTYSLLIFDFHLNYSTTAFPGLLTPPPGAIDAREVGVRPLGSYWGAAGEQIDMRSGNLNFTLPLIKAQGRGGWSVGFNLTYNSQNWRQDSSAVWHFGADTGYGYGWQLRAGSLTPVYQDYWTIHHWLFIDSTGAKYRLDQWDSQNRLWTSHEGIFIAFSPDVINGSTHLYFPDGSFWELNALSGGTEPDAGTYYPTLMEDTNGNEVIICT